MGPGLPRWLQLSFCGSLHSIIVGEVAETLNWRESCTRRRQSQVLWYRVLWQVWEFPDAYRFPWFSPLCITRQEGIKRERKRRAENICGMAMALWPCLQLFSTGEKIGRLAVAAWSCARLLCALKSYFKGWWVNIICPLCVGSIFIGRKSRITGTLLPWKSEVFIWNNAGQGPRSCKLSPSWFLTQIL